jgi:hypothetical protein
VITAQGAKPNCLVYCRPASLMIRAGPDVSTSRTKFWDFTLRRQRVVEESADASCIACELIRDFWALAVARAR